MPDDSGSKGINLLLVTHYYATHRGGIEIVADQLALRLVRDHSLAITWAASNTDTPSAAALDRIACVPMRTWNITEDRMGVPYPLWGLGSLSRLWSLVGKADIVHLHDFPYLGNICSFLFAKLRRKRVVITQHIGLVPYRSAFLRLLMLIAIATIGRFMMRFADQVVFISEVVMEYFRERARFNAAPKLIPNGVDMDVFRPADPPGRAAARRKLELSEKTPVLLFVGRFVEKKGLHILQQLAERLPHTQWILAGWGPIDPTQWNLPNVKVLFASDKRDLAKIYQAADLLVLPSVGEGFPLVVQEAMACGTPVLVSTETARACTKAPSLMFNEKVEMGNAERDTVETWTSRLLELTENPGTLSDMRDKVQTFAREYWSWNQCAALYAEVIKEVMTNRA